MKLIDVEALRDALYEADAITMRGGRNHKPISYC